MSQGRSPSLTPPQVIRIDYASEGFSPGGLVSNGYATLTTSWDELLWAAITVGRPSRQFVFRYGTSSVYEAMFRLSLVRMTLEQARPSASRLRRTDAARTLDPSEKGAVNYFLGMIMCKLFCARLLRAPWLLHLDVFRPQLNPVLTGRSRPDLVGQTNSGEWVAIESKGRVSTPNSDVKSKAKQQAERLVSVDGAVPSFHIGAITYFRGDVLQFFWRDPEPGRARGRKPIKVSVDESAWSHYYLPVLELLRSQIGDYAEMLHVPHVVPIKQLDVELGIHPRVLGYLIDRKWGDAKRSCLEYKDELHRDGYQADGIRLVTGPSWLKPFEEFDKQ